MLRRLFFAFPGGLPGISLLLLRAVFGVALAVEGLLCLGRVNPAPALWIIGLGALLAGGLLLIGYLTPIIALAVGVGAIGIAISVVPECPRYVFASKPALIFASTILLNVIGLGPGAFSVDALVFGRREIIIPPPVDRNTRLKSLE